MTAIAQKSKKIIKKILSTHLIGRLSRKTMHLIRMNSHKALQKIDQIWNRLPYHEIANSRFNSEKAEVAARYLLQLKERQQELEIKPKISVLIPMYKTNYRHLKECIDSVINQIYENWELCIVDDKSEDPELIRIIESYQKQHPGKIKYAINEKNSHISVTSNHCLELATGEYTSLLDHDDRLYPNALAEVVRFINLNNQPDILYSDERTVSDGGEPLHTVYYKPGWSPYMHLCMNYTTHLSTYRTELLRKIGGFRAGFEGSQDHDLMLRAVEASEKPVVHIPMCLYQWRAHALSTAGNLDSKPYAAIAGEKAVSEALNRRGFPAKVSYEKVTGHYRLDFELKENNPLVSIIIPNKNSYKTIKTCIDSVLEKSTYSNFEIIVTDNGTDDQDTLDYYESLKKLGDRFSTIIEKGVFNFGRQNNRAIKKANGEYCILLNNDTEVVTPDWIERLLQLAQMPDVGAVSCKLLYPDDDTVQHGGIISAGKSVAFHIGNRLPREHSIYCHILNTIHECTAVTAACMMVKKSTYEKAGGLNEDYLANGYGDFEFCLTLGDMGLKCLYTPYAELYHYESKTRGKSIEYFEKYYMYEKHGKKLLRDPYLNPNLQYSHEFRIDEEMNRLDLNNAEFMFFQEHKPNEWLDILERQ